MSPTSKPFSFQFLFVEPFLPEFFMFKYFLCFGLELCSGKFWLHAIFINLKAYFYGYTDLQPEICDLDHTNV